MVSQKIHFGKTSTLPKMQITILGQRSDGEKMRWPPTPKVLCKCQNCGKDFLTHQCSINRGGGKYCSPDCYHKSKEKMEIICAFCGKPALVYQSAIKRNCGKYCSRGCFEESRIVWWDDDKKKEKSKWMKKWYENPANLNLLAKQSSERGQTKETRELLRSKRLGKLNPFFGRTHTPETREIIRKANWKGGLTELQDLIRRCTKYYEWRNAVFQRDNYHDWFSGIDCGNTPRAHHIIRLRYLIKQNNIQTIQQAYECDALWDIYNGVTMLETTHSAYHQMWGR